MRKKRIQVLLLVIFLPIVLIGSLIEYTFQKTDDCWVKVGFSRRSVIAQLDWEIEGLLNPDNRAKDFIQASSSSEYSQKEKVILAYKIIVDDRAKGYAEAMELGDYCFCNRRFLNGSIEKWQQMARTNPRAQKALSFSSLVTSSSAPFGAVCR